MNWPDDYINQVICGDCLEILKQMPDQSVQCCITSPPYFGLRDYGTGSWQDGDPNCDHIETQGVKAINTGLGYPADGGQRRIGQNNTYGEAYTKQFAEQCQHRGAVRVDKQIGLEQTPEEYVAKMLEVFREVGRILKDDGTLWLNLGDSYCGSWGNYGGQNRGNGKQRERTVGSKAPSAQGNYRPPTAAVQGLKPKDLIGIPWMVAFALRADGWYLRQDIIWSKPNPMPESVTDRPTKAHEYLFLLSKSPKYYYDGVAIREPLKESSIARLSQNIDLQSGSDRANGGRKTNGPMKAVARSSDKQRGHSRRHAGFNDRWDGMTKEEQQAGGCNKRSVWTVATQPFSQAHFATFPVKLIEPAILAGCPEGGIVLDPFFGSGTTGLRAKELGRRFVGIELNPEYIKIAEERLAQRELF